MRLQVQKKTNNNPLEVEGNDFKEKRLSISQLQVELSCYSRQETVFLSTQLNIKMATGNMLIPLSVS